jgi:hypothetical protein
VSKHYAVAPKKVGNIKLKQGQTLSKSTGRTTRKQRKQKNKDMYPYFTDASTPMSREIESRLVNGKLYTLQKNVLDETEYYFADKETLFHYVVVTKHTRNLPYIPKGTVAIYLGMRDVREITARTNSIFNVKRHSFRIGDRIFMVRDLGMFVEEKTTDVDDDDDDDDDHHD